MKTVMDAVIELRGSIGAVYDGGLYILYQADTGTYNLATMEEYALLSHFRKSPVMVCPLNTFNATVTLLSHAPWIKGASLEEYQAADKEVIKVVNKTIRVTVNSHPFQVDATVSESPELLPVSNKQSDDHRDDDGVKTNDQP